MRQIRPTVSFFVAIFVLAACAVPKGQTDTSTSVQQLAATIAAATINAQLGQQLSEATTPAAPAATPTIKPALFINVASSNCHSGPGQNFKVVAVFAAGTTVDLVGKDSADSYWIVQDPAGHDLCWIQTQDATPAGSFEALPEMTPRPVTVKAPPRPGNLSYQFFCDNTTLTVSLLWNDASDTENGYRVFRKDIQVADLGANTTTFTENVPYTMGVEETYRVVAYNDAGSSEPRSTPPFACK